MQIARLRLQNYKSFDDSGWLKFARHFTVIVGQNNAGKTALLEAFRLVAIPNKPHRTLTLEKGIPTEPSKVEAEVDVNKQELIKSLSLLGTAINLPVIRGTDNDACADYAKKFLASESFRIAVTAQAGSQSLSSWRYPSHNKLKALEAERFVPVQLSGQKLTFGDVRNGRNDDLPRVVEANFRTSIYVFRAERLNIGRTPAQESSILTPDGTNLAAVLMWLQSNPIRFERLNKHVREIFPNIQRVVVAPVGNEYEVRIWSVSVETEREDLAIPLQESGTGVGQVLAILFVAMTIESGLIVIDEPNNFLHPGAAKKLIQILRQYDSHQYVLATHSGDLVATAEPEIIHLVTWADGRSLVEQVGTEKITDLKRVLSEVGASFSDVFGFERAIWVEGQTEEICFPLINKRFKGRTPLGLIFLAVKNTGDFSGRKNQKQLIWDIYARLSSGLAILPTQVLFSFDREGLSQQDVEDLVRESRGRVHFLARRTYENYLIQPDAIAAVLNTVEREGQAPVAIEAVQKWLVDKGGGYISGNAWNGDFTEARWLTDVDGAKMLAALFDDLSGVNLHYQKTIHSVALTNWLLQNRSDCLTELAQYIEALTTALDPPPAR